MKNNKIQHDYNHLCEKCLNKCKQKKDSTLISCPKFKPKPKQLFFIFK